ncbi:MAG: alpha/beta fold hydrolase [Betaproteobacteria bacterium]|nr:alpha/beta fold hydrolase [Betaproteobacteria bacterium]MCC6250496.1 alpha/beta fold hydrolase [Rubrivivax sp.]MCL4698537.1 alpha/beta hydrolase [Burkholderiaceae bacterium]NUP96450.1 alpha/beta fold hydrolase [Planctomycetaceae bacterium]
MPTTLEEVVSIEVAADERVRGTFVAPGTLMPGVLFVHGWGGSQEQYLARARAVASLGCVCLAFDLRGHAENRPQFGTVSRSTNLRDVEAAYDRLVARRYVDRNAIAVIGSSYGGYLASILTTMRPVRWLGLRAPALYMDSGWELPKLQLRKEQDLVTYRSSLVPAETNRALRACQAFDGDMLLIESEFDETIPAAVLASYRQAATRTRSLTFRCIKGADHGLTSEDSQRAYTTVLLGWLKEMVSGARVGQVPAAAPETAAQPETPPQTIREDG